MKKKSRNLLKLKLDFSLFGFDFLSSVHFLCLKEGKFHDRTVKL